MRILRRRARPGELPGVNAKGSWRTRPGGEVVGYVRYTAPLTFILALHEVAHILRRQENEMHHSWWHFCALATGHFKLGSWCTTLEEREAARTLLATEDTDFDVPPR